MYVAAAAAREVGAAAERAAEHKYSELENNVFPANYSVTRTTK